ncbi:MAG: hypothetical protein M0008_04685, partial [Actinomycetota bacterium]|nr:hypothetical protein [Actinomycetota bacterium]
RCQPFDLGLPVLLAAWLSSYHEHQVYTTAASVSSSPLHRHVLGGRGLRVHRIFTFDRNGISIAKSDTPHLPG